MEWYKSDEISYSWKWKKIVLPSEYLVDFKSLCQHSISIDSSNNRKLNES